MPRVEAQCRDRTDAALNAALSSVAPMSSFPSYAAPLCRSLLYAALPSNAALSNAAQCSSLQMLLLSAALSLWTASKDSSPSLSPSLPLSPPSPLPLPSLSLLLLFLLLLLLLLFAFLSPGSTFFLQKWPRTNPLYALLRTDPFLAVPHALWAAETDGGKGRGEGGRKEGERDDVRTLDPRETDGGEGR